MSISYYEERHFGEYGGQYVPETLMTALEDLDESFRHYIEDEEFRQEYRDILQEYSGRPTPLTLAEQLSEEVNTEIWLKREDLNHTGAHKL
ncbi:MAG: tryptophan synthase subunit beta, partial [bacterium]